MKTDKKNIFANPIQENTLSGYGGLTLRNHFAGLAMQALIVNPNIKRPSSAGTELKQFAKIAFEYADAMIEVDEETEIEYYL